MFKGVNQKKKKWNKFLSETFLETFNFKRNILKVQDLN